MKLKMLLLSMVMCIGGALGNAVNPNRHVQRHHCELANYKPRLNQEVIRNMRINEILEKENIIDDLLKEAESHVGKRYVWGSRGPNTFDCSGFTSYVYKQFGYNIHPGSYNQYYEGEHVKKENAKKGDLIFFKNRIGTRVGHVGIIHRVDEDGKIWFIHASITGVKISELEGYYIRKFVGIKRIIKE